MRIQTTGKLAAAATLALLVTAVPAQGRALDCGAFVVKDVVLQNDLDCSAGETGGLFVAASGVTIDLNGHEILGAGGLDGYEGIEISGRNNVTVKNGAISDFQDNILLKNAANITVRDVHFKNDDAGTYNGIYSTSGSGNKFIDNYFARPKYGIYSSSGSANTIAGNRFYEPRYATYTENDSYDRIIDNRSNGFSLTTYAFWSQGDYQTLFARNDASGGFEGFHLVSPTGVTISDSTANGNGYSGVYIQTNLPASGYSATVRRTTANRNGEYGMYGEYGVSSWSNRAIGNGYYNCFRVRCND